MNFETVPVDFKGFYLEDKDFKTTIDGVLVGYNSHVIKYIMMIQKKSENLNAVILSLETEQAKDYSAIRNLILSYLIDIRDNTIPQHTLDYWRENNE